jgi:membrane protease YdiL (CAAX protease family)
MRNVLTKLFRWQPARETLISFLAGLLVIGLSLAMMLTRGIPWLSIIIRDIGQIFLVGILFPLLYIQRSDNRFAEFGFSLRKWYIFLPINLALAILLLLLFLSDSPPPADFRLSAAVLWRGAFVMLALCFELVFFYAFQRTLFTRAFGFVPGILLTALFYAFHHIGFQPEYGKLTFVGLIYATTYTLGNSALLIFPFFLGVGGLYDVLIQSQVVSPIMYPLVRTIYLATLFLVTVIWLRTRANSGDV